MVTAFLETFETDGNTLNGGDRYTTSIAEFLTGSNRTENNQVFTRSDDTDLDSIRGSFTGNDGTWFAVSDFDGNGNNAATATMEFTGIDISGLTDLSFSGIFAEFNPTNGRNHWDADSQVFFEVSIDGGAYTKIMQFASDRATGNNRPAEIDTNLDDVGDGARLTRDFATFSSDITGTDSTLDLRKRVCLADRKPRVRCLQDQCRGRAVHRLSLAGASGRTDTSWHGIFQPWKRRDDRGAGRIGRYKIPLAFVPGNAGELREVSTGRGMVR